MIGSTSSSLIFLLCLLLLLPSSSSPPLSQLLSSSSLALSPALYKQHVLEVPKGYRLLVLYTTDDAGVCAACAQVNQDFKELARNYAREGKKSAEFGVDGISGDALVFVTYDVMQDREIVQLHQMATIPMVVSVTNRSIRAAYSRDTGKAIFKRDDVFKIQAAANVGGGVPSLLSDGLAWINMKTSRDVALMPSSYQQSVFVCKLLLLMCLLGVLLWLAILLLKAYPVLIPVGAFGVQMLSTSGLFFSFQNSVPFTGTASWVSKSGRSQYLSEGLLMGFTLCAAAACLLLAVCLPYMSCFQEAGTHGEKGGEGGKRKAGALGKEVACCAAVSAARVQWWWRCISKDTIKNIMLLLLLGMFVALLQFLVSTYTFKAPWYAPTFMPPADYIRGDLRVDRGNEF
eukprot:GHVS01000303.1.p1 GENE.GHVS01000303.1~~GHVS01000303.1.p1  ORF type:complete len:445 (+),score=80.58 GHVS01000303.1:133-1335(+)